MVPVSQSVYYHVVFTRLKKIERLDTYSFYVEVKRIRAVLYFEIELLEQGLVTYRPTDVGPE